MSSEELMLDVSQAHELKLAFRRNGWSNANIKKLSEGNLLAELLPVVLGQAKVVSAHIIDCDDEPFLPDGCSVHEEDQLPNRVRGQLEWNPTRIRLHLSKKQTDGKMIEGNKLRKELEGLPVMNANVLDYLLKHPELIPDKYKGKAVFFWGTIYRNSSGSLYVRYLCWLGGEWYWHFYLLGSVFRVNSPAAVSASI